MSERRPLDVVLCWHMHQPDYRRASTHAFQLPWTYLHAIKDYSDMAWHLEQHSSARAVVNLTPVLLDQLDDYSAQFASRSYRDRMLQALDDPSSVADGDLVGLIEACFRANADRLVRRHPPYQRLRDAYDAAKAGGFNGYLSPRFLADVAVWYHLAWLGESIARDDARAKRLREKESGFDAADRHELLGLIGEIVQHIVPRYAALGAGGRIELSTSPYSHPILPLLIDLGAARESVPDVALPAAKTYPGGAERAVAHVRAAIASHARRFGKAPAGCWPSEGAVSNAAVALLAGDGFAWTASCETVLTPTLAAAGAPAKPRPDFLYQPYLFDGGGRTIAMFFRDVRLSDLIGFRYADWHADDAVANLVGELDGIARAVEGHEAPVVSIILDGENAWEHYPENGFYFLSGLYRALDAHPGLRLTTFSEHLARRTAPIAKLGSLVAGSWVYGTLSTWIGAPAKNRAWDLLAAAKSAFDAAVASGSLAGDRLAAAEAQLKVCEGSDWFWWFGDENPADTVSDYDRLYRDELWDLYALIGAGAPGDVTSVIGVGRGQPERGGSMRANPMPQPGDVRP